MLANVSSAAAGMSPHEELDLGPLNPARPWERRNISWENRGRGRIFRAPGLVAAAVALMQAPSVCSSGAAAAAAAHFVVRFSRADRCVEALVEAGVADSIVALAMQPAVAASADVA